VIQSFNASEKPVMPPEIDLYCERTAVGIFNEPLGLISNVAFLIAAFYLSRQPRQSIASYLLIAWLSMIGIGSGLFHAFATTATLLMDVIPIQGLILTAIWVLYAIHLKWKWWVVFGLMALCVLVSAELPRNWLNGSAGYLPAWIPTDDCGNSSSTGVIATIFADGHASLSDIADVSEHRQSPLSGNSIWDSLYVACL
jgi:hypothetical protein